jgi:hypothetical protein
MYRCELMLVIVVCRHVPEHAERQHDTRGLQPQGAAHGAAVCTSPVGRVGLEWCAMQFPAVCRHLIDDVDQGSGRELRSAWLATVVYLARLLGLLSLTPWPRVLYPTGRVPKTNAIKAYLRALQEREPQWVDRISQVTLILEDPTLLVASQTHELAQPGIRPSQPWQNTRIYVQ